MSENRICVLTVGCRTNSADSSILGRLLVERGYVLVTDAAQADWVIVNSCTVTHGADRDVGKILRRAGRAAPKARRILLGCLPKAYPDHPATKEAEAVIPGASPEDLLAVMTRDDHGRQEQRAVSESAHSETTPGFPLEQASSLSRVNIKIQEGCGGGCSYCIVPAARGAPHSRPEKDVVSDIRKAFDVGYQEVVLTGTHLARYRQEAGAPNGLVKLMKRLEESSWPGRFRLSSLEPDPGLLPVVQRIASSRLWCRHLHLSLQHACDDVLQAMNRPYSLAEIRPLLKAAGEIPGLCLGMDYIVGYPSETREQFEQGVEMLEQLPFTMLHVFSFSPRPGTPAARLKLLPSQLVKARSRMVRKLAARRRQEFLAMQEGTTADVLVEHRRERSGLLVGLTDNYLRVYCPGDDERMGTRCTGRLVMGNGNKLLVRCNGEQ